MRKETGRRGCALAPIFWAPILWAGAAYAQAPARPANEAIGSWILSCPPAPGEPCLMRHRDWVLAPANGTPSAALEVQLRGTALVPVITVRGLPASAAIGGAFVVKPTVNIGFDGGKRSELSCGVSGTTYACAPDASSVAAIAAVLPKARVLSSSVTLTIPGMIALPPQERSLDLSGTEAALARLRAVGATGESLPAYPGLDMQGFLDRIMRDLGFPNGAADVMPKVLPWVSWLWS